MNNISLDLKEQKILWMVLNQAQDIGLRGLARQLKESQGTILEKSDINLDWLKQTQDEYETINILKTKLCGDLE